MPMSTCIMRSKKLQEMQHRALPHPVSVLNPRGFLSLGASVAAPCNAAQYSGLAGRRLQALGQSQAGRDVGPSISLVEVRCQLREG